MLGGIAGWFRAVPPGYGSEEMQAVKKMGAINNSHMLKLLIFEK
jgi:hypothetical protein